MAETTQTKAPRKTSTRKKATDIVTPQVDMSNITPEMFAQFQAFMAMQQGAVAPVQAVAMTNERPATLDKRWLKTVKDREVRVTSCYGRVIYKSKKTGETFKWLETGDDQYFTVQDVLDMDNQSHKFLRTPWLLIDDEEVVEAMGLTQMYSYINRLDDIDAFLASPLDEIEEVCKNLSKGYKCNLARIVNQKVEEKELRDIVVIRKLQELLDKDFDY